MIHKGKLHNITQDEKQYIKIVHYNIVRYIIHKKKQRKKERKEQINSIHVTIYNCFIDNSI